VAGVLTRWKALDVRGRAIFAGLAAVAALAVVLAFALERDTRAPLFAEPLRTGQIEEVAELLAQWNVPYVVTADNVRVEASRRNDMLLKLTLLGVPHAHLGSLDDALARAGPLTPQSVLDAQALDGRAGDLAAGLRGVAGVEDARIIIAAPKEATFADDDAAAHETTASVRLTLSPGALLSRAVVAGVRAYVAAGVPGLAAQRVAILDDRGRSFDDTGAGEGEEEATLANSLQTAFDSAFGAGATIVRVRVNTDPRSSSRRDLVRRPLPGATRSVTSEETYSNAGKRYAKSSASLERGSETHDETVDTPAGRVERLSVAVAVDRSRGIDVAKVRTLAAATLGLAPERGDRVSVESIDFPQPRGAERELPWLVVLGAFMGLAPGLVAALGVVLSVRFAAKPVAMLCETLVQRLSADRTSRAVAGYAPAQVRGALAGEPPHTAAAIISALPAATATAVLEMYSAEERAAIVRRMSRAAAPAVPDYQTVLRRG
jgi:flagellar biosynthesis/type III secretory pathway M-ring protein FliF/YscJ